MTIPDLCIIHFTVKRRILKKILALFLRSFLSLLSWSSTILRLCFLFFRSIYSTRLFSFLISWTFFGCSNLGHFTTASLLFLGRLVGGHISLLRGLFRIRLTGCFFIIEMGIVCISYIKFQVPFPPHTFLTVNGCAIGSFVFGKISFRLDGQSIHLNFIYNQIAIFSRTMSSPSVLKKFNFNIFGHTFRKVIVHRNIMPNNLSIACALSAIRDF